MKKHAFSLIEMMVVLLIISIILAATAPIAAKKMAIDRTKGGSPWLYTDNNGSIGYNVSGKDVSAIIGATRYNKGNDGPENPRLVLAADDSHPAFVFADRNGNYIAQITVDSTNKTLTLGGAKYNVHVLGNLTVDGTVTVSNNDNSTPALTVSQGNISVANGNITAASTENTTPKNNGYIKAENIRSTGSVVIDSKLYVGSDALVKGALLAGSPVLVKGKKDEEPGGITPVIPYDNLAAFFTGVYGTNPVGMTLATIHAVFTGAVHTVKANAFKSLKENAPFNMTTSSEE